MQVRGNNTALNATVKPDELLGCTPGIMVHAEPVAARTAIRLLVPDVRAERRPAVEFARLQILHDHLVAPDAVACLQHSPAYAAVQRSGSGWSSQDCLTRQRQLEADFDVSHRC